MNPKIRSQGHKADVECVEHALNQIEYAKSGGTFTPCTRNKLRQVIALLRQVQHTRRYADRAAEEPTMTLGPWWRERA